MNINNGGMQFLRLTWKVYLILTMSHLSCDVSHPSPSSKYSYPVYADYFSGSPNPKEDVVALQNSPATFDCVAVLNATGRNVSVHWTKGGINIDKFIHSNPRYQLAQEPSKNGTKNFSLTIVNATVEDEGEFQCFLQFSNPNNNMGENFTQVTIPGFPANFNVDIPATQPVVFPASPVKTRIGQVVTLTCRSTGRPSPMISWRDTNQTEILKGVTNRTEYVRPLYTATSQLVFKAEDHHHNGFLRCVVVANGRSGSVSTSTVAEKRRRLSKMTTAIRIQISSKMTPDLNLGDSFKLVAMEIGGAVAVILALFVLIPLFVCCYVKYRHRQQGTFNVNVTE